MNASVSIGASGVRKAFAGTEVLRGLALTVRSGSVVALLGPSGCGKTTLLRCIAGLERIDGGEIRVGDELLSGPERHTPPERRRIGMVFQDWALFPHLTVAQNVAYGLPRAERRGPRATEALAMVGLADLGGRKPATLSGGQQQRVALARALAPRPRVLLLDEPFSNLDTVLRVQVRTEVYQLLAELGVTTVFVTHDQEEAFVLGDEVAVMNAGRVVQQARPSDLYGRPASRWVADFVGEANLLAGEASGTQALTPVGTVPIESASQGPVQVLLRPEELRLSPPTGDAGDDANGGSAGSAPSAVPATVELQEYYGHDTVYVVRVDGYGEPLRVRAGSIPQFSRGDRVSLRYAGPPTLVFTEESAQAEQAEPEQAEPAEAAVRTEQPEPEPERAEHSEPEHELA